MVIVKPARELADIVEEEKAARERESEECQAVAGHVEASLAVLDKLQAALDEQEIDILRLKSDVKGKQRALKVFKDREAMHTALCSRGGPATAPLSVLWVFALFLTEFGSPACVVFLRSAYGTPPGGNPVHDTWTQVRHVVRGLRDEERLVRRDDVRGWRSVRSQRARGTSAPWASR